jgi:8-oxo-dGTP pyrophosphatase MutT (NUDIX family)
MVMAQARHYFQSMLQKGQIRIGARAIITNSSQDRFLVEKNLREPSKFLNFIGGGLKLGETLDECLIREIQEETLAEISSMEYLFYVENFIDYQGKVIHGIGFYYIVELDREEVISANDDFKLLWFSKDELSDLDLRPYVVRDCIQDGSYKSLQRLVNKNYLV